MIHIIIADDHNLVRQGIRALIEKDCNFEVIGETADGFETLTMVNKKNPDVLILDIAMPLLTGIQVLERMKIERCKTRVLMLSMYSDEEIILQALKSGAKGYLLKDSLKEELVQAIHVVNDNVYYMNSIVSDILMDSKTYEKSENSNPLHLLTSRQVEILKLIAEGYTNLTISSLLNISVKTVEKHRSDLISKLKVQDTASLIKLAIRYHLIFIDEDPTPLFTSKI